MNTAALQMNTPTKVTFGWWNRSTRVQKRATEVGKWATAEKSLATAYNQANDAVATKWAQKRNRVYMVLGEIAVVGFAIFGATTWAVNQVNSFMNKDKTGAQVQQMTAADMEKLTTAVAGSLAKAKDATTAGAAKATAAIATLPGKELKVTVPGKKQAPAAKQAPKDEVVE